jgi:drug/metabolite transporter (DMT)-like permease
MSTIALGLVLIAAFVHACWNLLAKRAGGDVRFVLLLLVAVAVLWAPLGLWFAWHEVPTYGALQWSVIGASGLLHLVYTVTLLRGYRLADLSVVYPLARGSGPVITALLSSVFLGEVLGWLGALGVAAVALGVFFIAGGPRLFGRLQGGGIDASERHRSMRGVRYGLTTGAFIAAYSVVDGYGVKQAGVSPVVFNYFGALVQLPFVALMIRISRAPDAPPLRSYWKGLYRPAATIAVLSELAYLMILYAVRLAPLSRVAPAREVSTLIAALLGGRLLREDDAAVRLFGAACIAGGVITLAAA